MSDPALIIRRFLFIGALIIERILSLISHFPVIDDLFRTSNKENASRGQRIIKLSENIILRFLSKINQHIAADNHVISFCIIIVQKIMLSEFHSGFNLIGNLIRLSYISSSGHPAQMRCSFHYKDQPWPWQLPAYRGPLQ